VSAIAARLDAYYRLVRLDRPIGTLLLLWPALWGLWFAAYGVPQAKILAIFVVGVFLTRSAGCAVNDFADRDFDPHVERTRSRPLAARRIAPWEAIAVAVVLFAVAFLLVLQLNRLTVLLSFAALGIAVVYPFLKRVFPFPQAWLGIAFGFSIPMAFAAETGAVPLTAWILLLANVFWAIAYDTEYAMVDRDDDRRDPARTPRRGGRDGEPRAVPRAHGLRRVAAGNARTVLRRPRRGGGPCHPSVPADTRTRPRRLLLGVPQQQLAGLPGFPRNRGGCLPEDTLMSPVATGRQMNDRRVLRDRPPAYRLAPRP
jgi:4-hydroxybenzoate polyprenyltransferase